MSMRCYNRRMGMENIHLIIISMVSVTDDRDIHGNIFIYAPPYRYYNM